MTLRPPTAEEQLAFLRKLRRLLDEGQFTATYKYALLHAIADLCVTKGDDSGASLPLSTRDIAEQFLQLYWRQAAPFPGTDTDRPLKQNTGKQAAVVRVLREARAEYGGRPPRVEAGEEWRSVVAQLERTVRVMPLWKLQTVGGERLEFLYEDRADAGAREIVLLPGVAYCFRQFYTLVTDMVQGAWTQHIRRTNDALLGAGSELRSFLFGTARRDLSKYREILRDVQQDECFYCRRRLRADAAAVDHFVPWRRYPFDLGHNFVLAHGGCNGSKGDRLAAVEHLRRWRERNLGGLYDLGARFDDAGLVHDAGASLQITRWAYDQVARAEGQVWVKGNELVRLTGEWERVLAV